MTLFSNKRNLFFVCAIIALIFFLLFVKHARNTSSPPRQKVGEPLESSRLNIQTKLIAETDVTPDKGVEKQPSLPRGQEADVEVEDGGQLAEFIRNSKHRDDQLLSVIIGTAWNEEMLPTLREFLATDPDNVLILQTIIELCDELDLIGCADYELQHFKSIAPENGLVDGMLLKAAIESDDELSALEHIINASDASRFDDYIHLKFELLLDASLRKNTVITFADFEQIFGMFAALPMRYLRYFHEGCNKYANTDSRWQEACVGVGRSAYRSANGFMLQGMGVALLKQGDALDEQTELDWLANTIEFREEVSSYSSNVEYDQDRVVDIRIIREYMRLLKEEGDHAAGSYLMSVLREYEKH